MSTVDERISKPASVIAPPRPPLPRGTPAGQFLRQALLSEYFVLILTITFFVIASIFFPTLSAPGNISLQLQFMWPLLAIAIGQTFVLIIGGIDLSIGTIMGISSVAGAAMMAQNLDPSFFDKSPLWGNLLTPAGGLFAGSEFAVPVAVIVMLLVGIGVGFLNGFAITRFNLAPFMVTLVTSTFFAAFSLWLTQSRNISGLPEAFMNLGKGDIISVYIGAKLTPDIARRDILPLITYPLVIAGGLAVVAQLILSRTVFGRRMYAIGTNHRASIISGIPAKRVTLLVYMFSGFCAAVAAILYSARLGFGQPSLGGGNILLDIIGAAVIGGTSLFGGKGSIRGTFFGVAFFVLLLNILNAMRLSPFIIDAVKGLIILIAALLDITRGRLANRERAA